MQYKNRCKRTRAPILVIVLLFVFVSGMIRADQPDWCKELPRPGYAKFEKIHVDSNWFEVHRIHDGLYAISEPRQFEEVISYLVVGSKNALLWDTGMGISKLEPVVSKLSSVPVIVLNSHTHPDHIGGNFEFKQIWGMHTAFTLQNMKGYSDPEMKNWVGPDNVCGSLPADFNRDTYAIRPFQISHFLKDREVIDLGGRQLEVMHTPGHTPDATCLIDRKNRLLFTGDTFYPGPIYLYSPETNFEQYTQSVNRLLQLKGHVDTLLTAHNEPVAAATSLTALHHAIEQIRNGKAKPMEKDGLNEYSFQGFSILLKKH